jgi:AraC-like DNA-binding protein
MNVGSEAAITLLNDQMISRTDQSHMEYHRIEKIASSQNLMDSLSHWIESIRLKSNISAPVNFSAHWAFDCECGAGRFYALTSGRCRLVMKELKRPVFLVSGDLVFIPHGQEHSLHDSLDGIEPSVHIPAELGEKMEGTEKNDSTTLVCGSFLRDSEEVDSLFYALPHMIHLNGEYRKQQPFLGDILRLIVHETVSAQVGSQTIIDQLVQILFIQAIRTCSDTLISRMQSGNIFAELTDPGIGLAIQYINQKPEMPWTVASLAEKACMSRSVFAARFTDLVGMPPLRYLHQCRMNRACRMLRETSGGIKKIANSIGYSSEAAFSNAFKRWFGTAPGQYRGTDQFA